MKPFQKRLSLNLSGRVEVEWQVYDQHFLWEGVHGEKIRIERGLTWGVFKESFQNILK